MCTEKKALVLKSSYRHISTEQVDKNILGDINIKHQLKIEVHKWIETNN